MSEIYAGSDLHLEFGGPIVVPECDLLLLSGDIFTPWRHPADKQNHTEAVRKREKKFFKQCQEKATRTLMIMGNHEHYQGEFSKTAEKIRSRLDDYPSITLLDNETVEVDDVAIFGSTFWTDMNQNHPEVMWLAGRKISDFSVIWNHKGAGHIDPSVPFRPDDAVRENTYARQKLNEFLSKYQDQKSIVMTHFPPSWACVDPQYSRDIMTYYFTNTGLDDLLLDNDGPDVWLYGHMHHRKEFLHGDKTRIIANARGYFGVGSENAMTKTFNFRKIVL